MALRDTWHRALVYFGLAEDHDYGPEYDDGGYEPETGSEEVFESRREHDAPVRRLPTARRARRDEIDDIFADDEPIRDLARTPPETNGQPPATATDTTAGRWVRESVL